MTFEQSTIAEMQTA